MRGSTWLGCRRSGVQIAPPRPSVTNWFICNGRSWPAPRTCCDRWIPDAPVGFLQLQFYLQSVSTNGSIWAFISEPRAPVIFQQRVFSWSQGDSRQVQGGAISQNAVSGQCTRSPHISGAIAGPCRKYLDVWIVYTAWWIVFVCAGIRLERAIRTPRSPPEPWRALPQSCDNYAAPWNRNRDRKRVV